MCAHAIAEFGNAIAMASLQRVLYLPMFDNNNSRRSGTKRATNNTLETRMGDNSAQSVSNALANLERGVLARIRHYNAMIDSNNSAQFCLGFIAKADRGVVRGPGEIQI